MYLDYYQLKEPPFELTPNPRFLYFSAGHREALNHLLYGIEAGKGFVLLTGEVGSGKTTICRMLLERLDPRHATALVLNPMLTPDQLLRAIAIEFGLDVIGKDRLASLETLNEFLLDLAAHGRDAVLIIDEAQALSDELLEQVRLISNLETQDRKLIQIVLMGQPELRERLDRPQLRQLRQRITVRFHLTGLGFADTCRYIQHRLAVAGARGLPCFTVAAFWRIYRYSRGIPRLINAVCDKALLAGFVHQTTRIDWWLVGLAIKELEGKIRV